MLIMRLMGMVQCHQNVQGHCLLALFSAWVMIINIVWLNLVKMTVGGGGLVAYLGTNDGRSVMKLIESGNQLAADVFEAMCYQITKSVGAMAAVLKGAVDAIIITGGLSYIKPLTDYIKTSTQFIAPVFTYPGEDEMSALLLGVLRVKNNIEQVKIYGGTNENN